jgi:hypothetical protein
MTAALLHDLSKISDDGLRDGAMRPPSPSWSRSAAQEVASAGHAQVFASHDGDAMAADRRCRDVIATADLRTRRVGCHLIGRRCPRPGRRRRAARPADAGRCWRTLQMTDGNDLA